jgi:hypothetical protein
MLDMACVSVAYTWQLLPRLSLFTDEGCCGKNRNGAGSPAWLHDTTRYQVSEGTY